MGFPAHKTLPTTLGFGWNLWKLQSIEAKFLIEFETIWGDFYFFSMPQDGPKVRNCGQTKSIQKFISEKGSFFLFFSCNYLQLAALEDTGTISTRQFVITAG